MNINSQTGKLNDKKMENLCDSGLIMNDWHKRDVGHIMEILLFLHTLIKKFHRAPFSRKKITSNIFIIFKRAKNFMCEKKRLYIYIYLY